MRLKGNLTVRPDTGTINTSPITTAAPILRLQHGCNHTFVIPGKITQILKSVQLMLFVLFLLSNYICTWEIHVASECNSIFMVNYWFKELIQNSGLFPAG